MIEEARREVILAMKTSHILGEDLVEARSDNLLEILEEEDLLLEAMVALLVLDIRLESLHHLSIPVFVHFREVASDTIILTELKEEACRLEREMLKLEQAKQRMEREQLEMEREKLCRQSRMSHPAKRPFNWRVGGPPHA
ncbi:hypothetical protein AVEN_76480-1 [Araneus ventricosus]|uniref:Uncharacterized protein n=1 Tax=Araneus ventricosus TaxID=182803 RepID=A0A4Y2CF60_ARAVE|nr:hypothetical protein AVEN_76480-1 [Araneus ventricosus]